MRNHVLIVSAFSFAIATSLGAVKVSGLTESYEDCRLYRLGSKTVSADFAKNRADSGATSAVTKASRKFCASNGERKLTDLDIVTTCSDPYHGPYEEEICVTCEAAASFACR
jgi:hypothetical protein